MTVWFITGAGRGFGLEIASTALEAGDTVVATARRPEQAQQALASYGDRVLALPLDVTDPASIEAAVAGAVERFGRIDVLVNNAGYGELGAFEEISPAQIERQFRTNVFGVFDVTRAVLPTMRAQRSGRILTISSLAGIVGIADYDGFRTERRAYLTEANHAQLGDPAKFGPAILELVRAEVAPERWPAGSDAVAEFGRRAEQLRLDDPRWAALSLSTDA